MKNNNKQTLFSSPLSRKLVLYIVLFSVVITVVLSAIQVYREYMADIGDVKSEFQHIRGAVSGSIDYSLWVLNEKEINTQLAGIIRLRDIDYIAIKKGNKTLYDAGKKSAKSKLHMSIPLKHEYDGREISMGTLYVSSSLAYVYQKLIHRIWRILLVNAVKIFAIVIFIFFIFSRLISRHLYDISNYTRSLKLGKKQDKLVLNRVRNPRHHDELDDVVDSLNHLYKSAEESIADAENNRRIFEDYARSSSDWYWQMGPDLRFTEISPNYLMITGEEPAKYLGKKFWETDLIDQNKKQWDALRNTLLSQKPFSECEVSRIGKDGKIRTASVSGVPVFNESGGFEGYRGTVRNITHIKNLEKQLIHSQKLDAVGRLASGVAHDYNNMLNVILGNIELFELTTKFEGKQKDYLQNIREATLRSIGLTRKLLGLARTESQYATPTSVNEVIAGLEMLISKSLTATVKIETRLQGDIWLVEIDHTELEDCLLNLAINARDAMPDGGVLTLSTENKTLYEEDIAGIDGGKPGEYVIISASDTGTGMSKDVMDNIFEPFYTTKIKGRGTGLGLSMVLSFVQRANGFIAVQSELGQGASFKIYLPRHVSGEETLQNVSSDNEPVSLPSGNETILVVDDETEMLDLAEERLSQLGYNVITAVSGDKAMKMINDGVEIDLLFSDIIMPGNLDGYQLSIQVSSVRPDVKVLMVSGYTDPKALKSYGGHALIGDAVRNMLHKPYSAAELANAVRALLDAA